MENNKIIFTAIITLVVGLGIGYGIGAGKDCGMYGDKDMDGMHMMNNGESMSMSDMMMDMNAQLKGKTGDMFDQAFLSEMIVHHQGAVEMAQLALTNAKHQEIKDLANGIISAQNKEIAEMKAWQKAWFNK